MIVNSSCQDEYVERVKLLWENPDATKVFNDQTIDVDVNGYSVLVLVCKFSTSHDYYRANLVANNIGAVDQAIHAYGVNWGTAYRYVNIVDEGMTISSATMGATNNNSYAIPYRIYGYR